LDARTAADLLNALRKDEAVEAEQAAQQAVQQDVQQQVAPDQPAPETPEIAAARQQIEAQWQQPNQVRAQYEQALPLLLQALHEQQAGEFGDIQSIADVEKMAREDYQRYARWDAHHKKVGAVREQMQQAQVRQAQEIAARWQAFTVHEDAAFDAEHPELQDPAVRRQAAEAVVATLKAEGLTDQQLHALYNQSDLYAARRANPFSGRHPSGTARTPRCATFDPCRSRPCRGLAFRWEGIAVKCSSGSRGR